MLKRIVIILLIIAATIGYSVYQKQTLESQLSMKPEAILAKMPQGLFETIEGKPFNAHDEIYGAEKVTLTVVHFWGTWCAPCEAELPDLLNFIKKFEGKADVKFLLVAVNDEKIKVEKHLKKLAVPRSSIFWLLDNNNIHRDVYGTTRVPETYVFSSDKSTLRKFVGPQTWNNPSFFQTFDEFIQISSHKL